MSPIKYLVLKDFVTKTSSIPLESIQDYSTHYLWKYNVRVVYDTYTLNMVFRFD